MATQQYFLTRNGLTRLRDSYNKLLQLRSAKVKNESPTTPLLEDVNGEYLAYYEDFNFIELELSTLKNILKNAAIIQPPADGKRDTVGLGAVVSLEREGKDYHFEITGSLEADPAIGKISNESPVGSALLGHRVGETVQVGSPINAAYSIRQIQYKTV